MNDPHDNEITDWEMLARHGRPQIDPDIAAAGADLGRALTRALAEPDGIRAIKGALGVAGYPRPSDRDMALLGYSPELKRLINNAIALDPALEETILAIAELAFAEGSLEAG